MTDKRKLTTAVITIVAAIAIVAVVVVVVKNMVSGGVPVNVIVINVTEGQSVMLTIELDREAEDGGQSVDLVYSKPELLDGEPKDVKVVARELEYAFSLTIAEEKGGGDVVISATSRGTNVTKTVTLHINPKP